MESSIRALRADAQRNYNRLLETAEKLFSTNGAAATLENIASQAGVGIGTLYRHFPTRKDLLEAVYAENITALVNSASRLLAEMSPDKALQAWLETIATTSVRYGGFALLLTYEATEESSSITQSGKNLLRHAQKAGLVRDDIDISDVLRLVNGVLASAPAKEDAAHTQKLVDIVVAGLRK